MDPGNGKGVAGRPGFAGSNELLSRLPNDARREGVRRGNPGSPCIKKVAGRPGFAGSNELVSRLPNDARREGVRRGNPGSPCIKKGGEFGWLRLLSGHTNVKRAACRPRLRIGRAASGRPPYRGRPCSWCPGGAAGNRSVRCPATSG